MKSEAFRGVLRDVIAGLIVAALSPIIVYQGSKIARPKPATVVQAEQQKHDIKKQIKSAPMADEDKQELEEQVVLLDKELDDWRVTEAKILFSIVFLIGILLIGVGSLIGIFSLQIGFLFGGISLVVYAYFMHGRIFMNQILYFVGAIIILSILGVVVWFAKKWRRELKKRRRK